MPQSPNCFCNKIEIKVEEKVSIKENMNVKIKVMRTVRNSRGILVVLTRVMNWKLLPTSGLALVLVLLQESEGFCLTREHQMKYGGWQS